LTKCPTAKPAATAVPALTNEGDRVEAARQWLAAETAKRPAVPRLIFERDSDGKATPVHPGKGSGFTALVCYALKIPSVAVVAEIIETLSTNAKGDPEALTLDVNAGLEFLVLNRPSTALEAVMLAQWWATSAFLQRNLKLLVGQSSLEAITAVAGVQGRVGTLNARALEAINKMRGGGRQEVRVTHVHQHIHVASGGQAVVADIVQGGGGSGNHGQCFEPLPCTEAACGLSLLGEDQTRDALPIACAEGQEAMPPAWRPGRSADG
jgi:hypothetical protein